MTMIKERFLRDSAVYKKFVGDSSVGDSSDGSAKYDEFSLTHVLVQRKSLINKSGEKHGSLVLYFFPEFSSCTKDGALSALPAPEENDRCVVDGEEYRIAECSSPVSGGTALSHVKLTMK